MIDRSGGLWEGWECWNGQLNALVSLLGSVFHALGRLSVLLE